MLSSNPQPFKTKLDLSGQFHLNVFRASVPKPTFFRLVGHSDEQSGGWLIEEIGINLKHCVEEKTKKISKFRDKYPEWWLVMPDQIGLALDDFERNLFFDQFNVQPGGFDKIILLDPRNAKRAFQVYPRKKSDSPS